MTGYTEDAWGERVPSGDQITAVSDWSSEDELAAANEEGRWAGLGEAAARTSLHPRVIEEAVRSGELLGGEDAFGRLKIARSVFGQQGQANALRRRLRGYPELGGNS